MAGRLYSVTPPAVEPVSLDEVYLHLRLDTTGGSEPTHPDDVLLTAFIQAAREHLDGVDGVLARALVTQTWDLKFDGFPEGKITIPLPPLQSIVSVKYLDGEGDEQTVDSSVYRVTGIGGSQPAALYPIGSWPTVTGEESAIVRFTAGYGVAADVPAPLRAAMLLMVEDLYRFRGSVQTETINVTPTVEALLTPYRAWWVA